LIKYNPIDKGGKNMRRFTIFLFLFVLKLSVCYPSKASHAAGVLNVKRIVKYMRDGDADKKFHSFNDTSTEYGESVVAYMAINGGFYMISFSDVYCSPFCGPYITIRARTSRGQFVVTDHLLDGVADAGQEDLMDFIHTRFMFQSCATVLGRMWYTPLEQCDEFGLEFSEYWQHEYNFAIEIIANYLFGAVFSEGYEWADDATGQVLTTNPASGTIEFRK